MDYLTDIPAGTLRLIRGNPNREGSCSSLYLLVGDATHGPIREILPEQGVDFPGIDSHSDRSPSLLRIFHFNDLHHHIVNLTHDKCTPVFSRMVWKMREVRQACQTDPQTAALLISGGDDLVGSVFDELLVGGGDTSHVHAAYQLYSAAGVDVGVIGNHDLDFGSKILEKAIQRDGHFPLLSANLMDYSSTAGYYYPAAILVTKGIRIGIVGLTTCAEIAQVSGSNFEIADPVEVAHNILPALKPHCDVLVLLTHLGFSLATRTAIIRGAGDLELAHSLPHGYVQLIIGAHTHKVINETGLSPDSIVNGIPIVQAGTMGQYLGEVDITLRPKAVVTDSRLWLTSGFPPDEDFEQEQVQPLVQEVQRLFEQPLGLAANISDLGTDSVLNHMAERESAMANFVSDAIVSSCHRLGEQAAFAMIDCALLSAGLEPGKAFTYGDWFNVIPFANTLRFCNITGIQLKALLEENVLRINRPNEANTERGFLQFSREIRYKVILGPERSKARAEQIFVLGDPLENMLDKTFRVVYPNFLRELSRSWDAYAAEEFGFSAFPVCNLAYTGSDLFLRDLMVATIQESGGLTEAGGATCDGRLMVE